MSFEKRILSENVRRVKSATNKKSGVNAPQFGQRGNEKASPKVTQENKRVVQPPSEADKRKAEAWRKREAEKGNGITQKRKEWEEKNAREKAKLERRRNKYNKVAEEAKRAAKIEALREKMLSHGGRFIKPNFIAETKSKPTNVGNPNPKGLGGNPEKNRTNPKKAEKIRRKQVQVKHKKGSGRR